MGNGETRKLADLGEYASVEVSSDGRNIVHIHFMNTSIRMCPHQFEKYIIMLNEAMTKININDQYFCRMKEVFNTYREMRNLNAAGKKNRLH